MKWWWQTDEYILDTPCPDSLKDTAGPKGIAVVAAFPGGTTSPGWGGDKFTSNYMRGRFSIERYITPYKNNSSELALVMRALKVVCIDVDGKNGGFEHAGELLGNAPYTLAERSKSGNGFHLFFSYPTEEDWSGRDGYALYGDSIGIVPGIDIRDVGCVFHYHNQRWNGRPIAPVPQWVHERLMLKRQRVEQFKSATQHIQELDTTEKLMLQDQLLEELKKPIPAGKRNNSLFAIGSKMLAAGIPSWEDHIRDRANDLALDEDETEKLLSNISKYGAN